MKWIAVIFAFVLIASVIAEDSDQDSINNLLNSDALSNLPSIDGLDTSQFNLSQAPSIEDAEKLFKEKCVKNADLEAFERALRAKDEVKECVLSLVNVTVLQEEMEKAKPTGDLDIVFKKYCRKSPKLRQCIGNFTAATEPCLDANERDTKHIVQNITDSLLQFICHKEGDRIALFIAEGGPECLTSHQEDIQACMNTTLSHRIPTSVPSINDLPSFVLGPEECADFIKLQHCVVKKLESCKEPTPANIVESMFKFIYKVTPCGKLPKTSAKTAQALDTNKSAMLQESFVVITSLLSLLATRYI